MNKGFALVALALLSVTAHAEGLGDTAVVTDGVLACKNVATYRNLVMESLPLKDDLAAFSKLVARYKAKGDCINFRVGAHVTVMTGTSAGGPSGGFYEGSDFFCLRPRGEIDCYFARPEAFSRDTDRKRDAAKRTSH